MVAVPNSRVILIVRTVLYGLLFILSMFIFSPMALQMNTHDGLCILYGDSEALNGYGERTTCHYCIAIGVLFGFVYGGIMTAVGVLTIIGKLKRPDNFHGLLFVINVVLDLLSLILVLIAACIISVGFKTLCDNLISTLTKVPDSCRYIYLIVPTTGDHDEFYNELAVAEAGAWISFIIWVLQCIIGIFLMWRNNMIPFLKNNSPSTAGPDSVPQTDKF